MIDGEKEPEDRTTIYRFGDDERELTAGEKETYAKAGKLAEKIHHAAKAAAGAAFNKMSYKQFRRAFTLPEWVKREEYHFFSKAFYQVYCWGYEEGKEKNNSSEERGQKNSA